MTTEAVSLSPCVYRRVWRGQTFCSRATDEFDQQVWPEVCARCPVPAWLSEGICRHLDIGTEVGRMPGKTGPRVFTSCRYFQERLEGLERCRTCPQFVRRSEEEETGESAVARLAETVPTPLLEEALQETLERHVGSRTPRMMVRCFRAGVARCLRAPQRVGNGVLVVPPASLRPVEGYRALVAGLLKEGGLEGYFFLGVLRDIDALCDLCLGIQQSPRLVVDLSEWDPAALFALALGTALGREVLLLRGRDPTPPFTPQGLPFQEYGSGEELVMALAQGLGIRLPEGKESGEGEEKGKGQGTDEGQPQASPE